MVQSAKASKADNYGACLRSIQKTVTSFDDLNTASCVTHRLGFEEIAICGLKVTPYHVDL